MKRNKVNKSNVQVIEQTIRGHMNDNGTVQEALTGLYNALAFGDILHDNGFEFSEADFTEMMGYLNVAIEMSKRFVK